MKPKKIRRCLVCENALDRELCVCCQNGKQFKFGASTEHFVVFLEKTQDYKIVPEVYQIKSWKRKK